MEETYQSHLDVLNRSIRRHFFPDTTAPDFCWNIGTSLQEILEESTAAAIRQMILPLNLPVKSTLSKQALIRKPPTVYADWFIPLSCGESPPPVQRVARDAGCKPLLPDSVSRRPRLSLRSSHYRT